MLGCLQSWKVASGGRGKVDSMAQEQAAVFLGKKVAKSSRTVAVSPTACFVMREHLNNEMALCSCVGISFNCVLTLEKINQASGVFTISTTNA